MLRVMSMSRLLQAAVPVLCLALFPMQAAAAAPDGPFARDFSLLTPPVPAPLEAFQDLDGGRVRLADFKGGVVLVNFWATWCAPCVHEMPALDRLQSILAGEGLTVLAVSIDRGGRDVVVPFAKKLGLKNLGLYLDPKSALARGFGIAGLPSTFLIDAQGRVVRVLSGAAEWDSHEAVNLIRHYLKAADADKVQDAAAATVR